MIRQRLIGAPGWQAVLLVLLLALAANAEVIQKWKTREGQLYFGDKPPAGSTKIGEEGSKEEPLPETQAPQREDPRAALAGGAAERFSIESSKQRSQIERALNRDAERYADVSEQITQAERLPDIVDGWMESRLGFANEKGDKLKRLRPERRELATAMLKQWESFDALDRQVRESYGSAPDWWRKPSCARCPSRTELRGAAQ